MCGWGGWFGCVGCGVVWMYVCTLNLFWTSINMIKDRGYFKISFSACFYC